MSEQRERWGKILQLLAGTGLIQLSSVLNFIVLARLLSQSDFASMRQLLLINQLVFTALFAALPVSMLYHSGKSDDKSEKSSTIALHIRLSLYAGVIVAIALFALSDIIALALNNESLASFLRIFSLYPLFYMVFSIAPTVRIALGRGSGITMFSLMVFLTNTVPVIVSAYYSGAIIPVLASSIAGAFLSAVIAVIYMRDVVFLRANRINHSKWKEILSYSGGLSLAAGISIIGLKIDHLLVTNILGVIAYSLYAVGAFDIPIYSLFQSSVNAVLMPKLTRSCSKQDWSEVKRLWGSTIHEMCLLLLPIAASFAVFSDYFVRFVFGEKYSDAAVIFSIFSILAPIRSVSFGLILRALGQSRYDFYSALLFLISSFVFCGLGVLVSGTIGAAVGLVFSVISVSIYMGWLTRRETSGHIGYFDILPVRAIIIFITLILLLIAARLCFGLEWL